MPCMYYVCSTHCASYIPSLWWLSLRAKESTVIKPGLQIDYYRTQKSLSCSPASWRTHCGKDPPAVARLMAQGNLSTGDPPLHRHIPDFGLRGFENDFGPPQWPASNKQCHSEVLAQWFLALQKSSPWKRDLLIFSIMNWTKLRATRRNNSRLPHWTKFPQKLRSQVTLERYIQNNPQFPA